MKKVAAITLLGILLFNWFGYQLFTAYMQEQTDSKMRAQLDDNRYDESQLISIKVPASRLAYYINSEKFERVDGQIEIEGVQYNYVKRRLYNDSVELLCIPNHAGTQLQNARDEFFKLVNDLQHPGKKGDAHPAYKTFSTDYYTVNDAFNLNDLYVMTPERPDYYKIFFPTSYKLTTEQPPDHC